MSLIHGTSPGTAMTDTWAAYHRPAGVRGIGWLVVFAVHAALLALWLSERTTRTAPPAIVRMQLWPVQPDLPPPVAPTPKPLPEPVRRQAVRQPPPVQPLETQSPPVIERAPPPVFAAPTPPAHRHVDSDEWVMPDATPAAPGARRAPPDYAEAVKSRVIAKVVYPANAVYPAPKGFKGDPRELMRQCTIPYEVVVDREGQIVSYEIERCGDDLLDAAAEAAVLKAQPFTPPPEGAEQYRIYGSINFIKPRLGRTAGSPP